MKQLFQSRVQQRLQQHIAEELATPDYACPKEQRRLMPTPVDAGTSDERALLLIDVGRKIASISEAAAALLGVEQEMVSGQMVDRLAHGAMSAIALRPNATLATTLFEIADGRMVQARTRPVFGREREFVGWVVELNLVDDLNRSSSADAALPVVAALQEQIESMQEFITMLPQFSQNQYWRQLLMEHMEELTQQMSSQVKSLCPRCA